MARNVKIAPVPSLNDRSLRRQAAHAGYVEMLRDGRKNRATTFKPAKGKGSYTRKAKHGGWT